MVVSSIPQPSHQTHTPTKLRKRLVLDQQLAVLRQPASGKVMSAAGVDQAGGDEFDVGVADEFEAFVGDVLAGGAAVVVGGFMAEGASSEGGLDDLGRVGKVVETVKRV